MQSKHFHFWSKGVRSSYPQLQHLALQGVQNQHPPHRRSTGAEGGRLPSPVPAWRQGAAHYGGKPTDGASHLCGGGAATGPSTPTTCPPGWQTEGAGGGQGSSQAPGELHVWAFTVICSHPVFLCSELVLVTSTGIISKCLELQISVI